MPDRLVVDLDRHGQVAVSSWLQSGAAEELLRAPFEWPLDAGALEDLRWYLEDYLRAPWGVWEERGPAVRQKLAGWGDQVFNAVFGAGPARFAYEQARDRDLEIVFRAAEPGLLGLPWELMRDASGPVALMTSGISRALPGRVGAEALAVPGGRLRVLMVISRPVGTGDIGYQMIARPLLERLDAVRGRVDLVVLRPPTLDALRDALAGAKAAGEPFQVVHFDGHGALTGQRAGGVGHDGSPSMMTGPGAEGVLAFEKPDGGSDNVPASKVAAVLTEAEVPVVVLNASQSGAVGKDLEAAVATRLLREGCAAVVAMAYSVYAVAAAEFMAVFYERLFAGDTISAAVTAGRRRLFDRDGRPSPKGELPLADWLVPVHYLRRDVAFPQAQVRRPAGTPSLEALLDELRAPGEGQDGAAKSLDPVGVFVGRDDLFFELEAAARLQKVVVLYGPGGTGKTELAKAFGRWWRDTGGVDEPGWVLWHSFEPGVASFGLDRVITETGLTVFGTDFARLDSEQRQQVVEGLLAERRLLLIWDNFETVRSMPDPTGATAPLDEAECGKVKDFLARLAARGKSAVIITSRTAEDWLGGIRRIGVDGLNRQEAAEYADYLLIPYPAAQQRRERRSFGELLEWLDGHPLAMRLTLPRLDTSEPAVLLAALQGATPLPSKGTGNGRLSSLQASITYSFAHLSEQSRRLLPAVSLFHGVADEDVLTFFSAVEGVPNRFAGVGKEDWTAALQDATQVGLLSSIDAGMYQIHPALPGYLAAEWRDGNPDGYATERAASERALRAACAGLSRWLTGQIGSGNAPLGYYIIGLQRETLGTMLGHALDHHAWNDADSIIRALDAYWGIHGLSEEAAAWAGRVLNATVGPDLGSSEDARSLWLYTIVTQANRQRETGRPEQAEQNYRQALARLQDQPETGWIRDSTSVIYHQLGITAQDRGRLAEAEDWYRKSLAIKEAVADRRGMAGTYHQLGILSQDRGRLAEAEDWYRKSLVISEELGNRYGIAISYHQLGMTAQDRGRLDEAEEWYRKSLTIEEELGDRPHMAFTYHQLGTTAQRRGQLDEAENWYSKSLVINEDLGNRPGMASAYNQLGTTAYLRGRLDEAEDWYRKSLAIEEELGDRYSMAIIYHQLGIAAQDRGRLDEAGDWYRRSLTIKEEFGDRRGMALSYAQLGFLAEDRAQARQALAWNIRSVTLFGEFPHSETGSAPRALARLTRRLGIPALEETWREVTGQALPEAVRDYIASDQGEAAGKPL